MLNIKGNPSLQNLDCRSCALQSLDLSGNPALQYIDCSSNYVLRTVDVRPCLSLFRFTGLDSVETVCVTANREFAFCGKVGQKSKLTSSAK